MAFDGITLSNIKHEIESLVLKGRIYKIYQPEKDEIIISIRHLGKKYTLLLNVNPLYPRVNFTNIKKDNPEIAPMFCMVLRKYLNNGKITSLIQNNFERILEIHIESLNELGDISIKKLIIEIMGKHSNIILVDENNNILDSIKHISFNKSSVREILPGRKYIYPPSKDKINPLLNDETSFLNLIKNKCDFSIEEAIYKSYNGIGPLIAKEICFRCNIKPSTFVKDLSLEDLSLLFKNFDNLFKDVRNKVYTPYIIYDENLNLFEFSSINLLLYENFNKKFFESISELLELFYKENEISYRSRQKSHDIKKIVEMHLERSRKKLKIQLDTIETVKNREIFKIYGDLIISNIHNLKKGDTFLKTVNFYSENLEEIEIPLEVNLTPSQNAQKYFKKYNKDKRTFIKTQDQIKENEENIKYLDSILTHLNENLEESDIEEIKEELIEEGFVRKRNKKNKKRLKKSSPFKYIFDDFFIYVGKNNKQNDELTMRFAHKNDIWLHAKNIPGSHVIIKTEGKSVSLETIKKAASLAAYYSKNKLCDIVSVDYTLKKYVRKPSGSKPGNVIYDNNKTLFVKPDDNIQKEE